MARARSATSTATRGCGADQVEGRVLRADSDGLLVDGGGRIGQVRHGWAEVGAGYVRVLRS
jgi:hypothetical protein